MWRYKDRAPLSIQMEGVEGDVSGETERLVRRGDTEMAHDTEVKRLPGGRGKYDTILCG